jgi:hypothetical protein
MIVARDKAPQPPRRERALILRNAILPWLCEHGHDEVIAACRVRTAEIGEFQLLYRTPFSGKPVQKSRAATKVP